LALSGTFKEDQLQYPRVRTAYAEKEKMVRGYFAQKDIPYPPKGIFLRVFKLDRMVELWAKTSDEGKYALVKTYKVCYSSGVLGPKRRQNDGQVPEGFYVVDQFNPQSEYYLSLRLNYPNLSDKILGVKGKLGEDVFMHGNCVSIGCIPITDDCIKEVYLIAVEARNSGQELIPIEVFPTRMDEAGIGKLSSLYGKDLSVWGFWSNLKEGYDLFEKRHVPPNVTVAGDGRYLFKEEEGL
jgi:murein L,D-transpeptidase YafK